MSFVSVSFAVLYLVALLLRMAPQRSRTVLVLGLLVLSWIFYCALSEFIGRLASVEPGHHAASRQV